MGALTRIPPSPEPETSKISSVSMPTEKSYLAISHDFFPRARNVGESILPLKKCTGNSEADRGLAANVAAK